jgi:hypothetical protein
VHDQSKKLAAVPQERFFVESAAGKGKLILPDNRRAIR